MSADWLGLPDPRENPPVSQQELVRVKNLDFAQLFLVFEQDARAAALLKHWIDAVESRDTAPNATHSEFAYWEGRRTFIRGIQRQLHFAKTEGRQQV